MIEFAARGGIQVFEFDGLRAVGGSGRRAGGRRRRLQGVGAGRNRNTKMEKERPKNKRRQVDGQQPTVTMTATMTTSDKREKQNTKKKKKKKVVRQSNCHLNGMGEHEGEQRPVESRALTDAKVKAQPQLSLPEAPNIRWPIPSRPDIQRTSCMRI